MKIENHLINKIKLVKHNSAHQIVKLHPIEINENNLIQDILNISNKNIKILKIYAKSEWDKGEINTQKGIDYYKSRYQKQLDKNQKLRKEKAQLIIQLKAKK